MWPCLIAGIAGSNLSDGVDICLLWLLCFVHVAAIATNWSVVQRSATGVCACVCVR